MILTGKELNHGLFGPAWNEESAQLASAVAMNDDGKFSGVVKAADRPLKISSPIVFAQILDVSRSMIREDGQAFPTQWRDMVDGLERAVPNTDLRVDSKTIRPESAGEILDQFERIREQMMSSKNGRNNGENPGNQQSLVFSGALNVNGREQRFSSPEEFQAAQKELFGPMIGRMMSGTPGGSLEQVSPGFQNGFPGNFFGNLNSQGNSNSSSAFSGMLNNNGEELKFTTPEEFNRAMQQFNKR
jgi:hypothetical protein